MLFLNIIWGIAAKRSAWRQLELALLLTCAAIFLYNCHTRSLQWSQEYVLASNDGGLKGLKQGWIWFSFNAHFFYPCYMSTWAFFIVLIARSTFFFKAQQSVHIRVINVLELSKWI